MKKIGIIHSGSNSGKHDDHIRAFKSGLKWAGFSNAKNRANVKIIGPVYADNDHAKLAAIAKTLISGERVDLLIAAGGSASSQAAKAATATDKKPVIFTSIAEPIRPAANMTGICARTSELDAYRLSLLHELLPRETRFGALVRPSRFNYKAQKAILEDAAGILGLALEFKDVDSHAGNHDAEIAKAFQAWAGKVAAVLVTADPLFHARRDKVVTAAKAAKLPAIYQWREFVDEGGLMSYGPNLEVAYNLAGIYSGSVLKNVPVKDLPVLPLQNFELIINLKAAKHLKLDIPRTLLARADDLVL
jgi:putative tryptophan/tyrosine transport system substrate-binding protein